MSTEQKKNYALPIIVMFALFAMISFVTGLQNPMGVIVKSQFGASNFMSQLGNAANFIAYAFMGIPAGMLLQRIGYKKTALLAVTVGFIGVGITFLSGIAESFSVYLVGAFISGFSMCMLNTVVNPMLNTLAGGGNKGNQLIQLGGSFNSISATIVPVVNIPEPHIVKTSAKKEKSKHSALSFRHFVLGTVAIFIYVGVEVGIPNFANLFMTSPEINIDPTIAGSVVGTYWFLMMIGRLCGASIGAKVSSRAMLTVVSTVGIVLVLGAIFCADNILVNMPVFKSDISFGFAQVPINVMLLILCGLCTSVMWGGIFNLAVEGLGKYTAAASGLFMVMVCGGGILPLIQGGVADFAGFLNSYWVIALGLAYILFYAAIGSKNVNTDIPTDDYEA